jgi:hypothetical protein
MNGRIHYIYFDLDGRDTVESYEKLRARYYKGIRTVYEYVFSDIANSDEALYVMSNYRQTDVSTKLALAATGVKFLGTPDSRLRQLETKY